jgi:glucosamine-6-phosphate deaminase
MLIIVTKDYKEMSKRAAELIVDEINNKPNLHLGLPTGETPIGMYKKLVRAYKNKKVNYSKIKCFNLDEYYPIKRTNKHSYHYFMSDIFFRHVNVKKSNIHILDSESKTPIKDCIEYERKLRENPLDIQILGVGINGHIAFNEPGSSLKSRTRLVDLSPSTVERNSRFFKDINDVPKKGLTMGVGTIMDAKKLVLLASGKNKAVAIKHLVSGKVGDKWPVSFLRKHKNLVVILDKEAAKLIKRF